MIITNADRWDRREFLDSLDNSHDMQVVEATGSERAPNYSEFMVDVFCSMYKYDPECRNIEDAPASEKWADEIYKEISALPEWKNLRERTKMNSMISAEATAEFCKKFMSALPKQDRKTNIKPVETAKGDEEITKYDGYTGFIYSKDAIKPPKLDMSKVRTAAREACEKAVQAADELEEQLSAFGYGKGVGNSGYTSPKGFIIIG